MSKTVGVLIFSLFFNFQLLHAQTKQIPEYQVKAAFLYNFTQFIDWPPSAFSSSSAPFIIGVIGKNPFGTYIEELIAGEKIRDHPIIVHHYTDVAEVLQCHVLFINSKEAIKIKEVLSVIGNRSILTVSDAGSFTKAGGMIRFFKEENKIRLQINIGSLKAAQLAISSKLLSVSRVFDPQGK